ncbi:hypothetical protein OHA77_26910 [Streptosporangium sp. NBC_01639]|uniref:hypothetical protein n=1 Tax=Streptosporangium sp. NBC_01639 TaxID=2975948 RepID=UPI00386BFE82|nr:hypothetical protein OHA77_26910 [Streptosporangium sp. NBC_01639]
MAVSTRRSRVPEMSACLGANRYPQTANMSNNSRRESRVFADPGGDEIGYLGPDVGELPVPERVPDLPRMLVRGLLPVPYSFTGDRSSIPGCSAAGLTGERLGTGDARSGLLRGAGGFGRLSVLDSHDGCAGEMP